MTKPCRIAIVLCAGIGLTCAGCDDSDDLSIQDFRRLAADGDAAAQHNLGMAYYQGDGIPKDDAKALKWFRTAANQGLPDAQNAVGVMYVKGEGTPQDYDEAMKWFRMGAEQGDARAQHALCILYGQGNGVTKNYVTAYMWLNLAIAHPPDEETRAEWVKARKTLATNMTPEEIAEAQSESSDWAKAHSGGN